MHFRGRLTPFTYGDPYLAATDERARTAAGRYIDGAIEAEAALATARAVLAMAPGGDLGALLNSLHAEKRLLEGNLSLMSSVSEVKKFEKSDDTEISDSTSDSLGGPTNPGSQTLTTAEALMEAQQRTPHGVHGSDLPDDNDFVLVDELNDRDAAAAEAALDYVVVGELTDDEEAAAAVLATPQQEAVDEKKLRKREIVRLGERSDPTIIAKLRLMVEKYPWLSVKRDCTPEAYGGPAQALERFFIAGVKVRMIKRSSGLVLCKDGAGWTDADTFFESFASQNPREPSEAPFRSGAKLWGVMRSACRTRAQTPVSNRFRKVVEEATAARRGNPLIAAAFERLRHKYPWFDVKRLIDKPAYGARVKPFEQHLVSGTTLTLMVIADKVVVKSGPAWVEFDKFFRFFSHKHPKTERSELGNPCLPSASELKTEEQELRAELEALRSTTTESESQISSDLAAQRTRSDALERELMNAKTTVKDVDLAELAVLQAEAEKLQERLLEFGETSSSTLDSVSSRQLQSTQTLRSPEAKGRASLPLDLTIAEEIARIRSERPNLRIVQTNSAVTGAYRTYVINGERCLIGRKAGRVLFRDGKEWCSSNEFIDGLLQRQATAQNIAAERAAATAVKEKARRDREAELQQVKLSSKTRRLADTLKREYIASAKSLHTATTKVSLESQKVSQLENELECIRTSQAAGQERKMALLKKMELMNSAMLKEIATAEDMFERTLPGKEFERMSLRTPIFDALESTDVA